MNVYPDCSGIESVSNRDDHLCASQVNELIVSCAERLMLLTVIRSSETIIWLAGRTIDGVIQIAEINAIHWRPTTAIDCRALF